MKKSFKKCLLLFSLCLIYAFISIFSHDFNLTKMTSIYSNDEKIVLADATTSDVTFSYNYLEVNNNSVISKKTTLAVNTGQTNYNSTNFYTYSDISILFKNCKKSSVELKKGSSTIKSISKYIVTTDDGFKITNFTSSGSYKVSVTGNSNNKYEINFKVLKTTEIFFTNINEPINKLGATDERTVWNYSTNVSFSSSINRSSLDFQFDFYYNNKETTSLTSNSISCVKLNDDIGGVQNWECRGQIVGDAIRNAGIYTVIPKVEGVEAPSFDLDISKRSGHIDSSSINVIEKDKINTTKVQTDKIIRYNNYSDNVILSGIDSSGAGYEFNYEKNDNLIEEAIPNTINTIKTGNGGGSLTRDGEGYFTYEYNFTTYHEFMYFSRNSKIVYEKGDNGTNLIKFSYYEDASCSYCNVIYGTYNTVSDEIYVDYYNSPIDEIKNGINRIKYDSRFDFYNNYIYLNIEDTPESNKFVFKDIIKNYSEQNREFDYNLPERIRLSFNVTTNGVTDEIYNLLLCENRNKDDCYKFYKTTTTGNVPVDIEKFSIRNIKRNDKNITLDLYYLFDDTLKDDEFGNYKLIVNLENNLNSEQGIPFSVPTGNVGYYVYSSTSETTYKNVAEIYVNRSIPFIYINDMDKYAPPTNSEEGTDSTTVSEIYPGYRLFLDDYNHGTNMLEKQYYVGAYNEYVSLKEEVSGVSYEYDLMNEDIIDTLTLAQIDTYNKEYEKFYSFLKENYSRYFVGDDKYYTFNEKVNDILNGFAESGPPGNITSSTLNLGFYLNDIKLDRTYLTDYSPSYVTLPHNVEKVSENKYRFYDTTRYKLIISDYNKVLNEDDELDKDESSISYSLIEYKINTNVVSNETKINNQSITDFETFMSGAGLDINNAFNHSNVLNSSTDDTDLLDIGNSLLDHIVKGTDNKIHITYNNKGKYVVGFIERGTDFKNGYLKYSDGTVLTCSTTATDYCVSSATNYSDYYYLSTSTDIEPVDLVIAGKTYNAFKPEDGAFVFETKSYPDQLMRTEEDLKNYEQVITMDTNLYCSSAEKKKYAEPGAEVVCYNKSTGDELSYSTNDFNIEEEIQYLKTCLNDPDASGCFDSTSGATRGEQIEAWNHEYNALLGVCQNVEERNEWCSGNSNDIYLKSRVYAGTYFIFVSLDGKVDFNYETDTQYFPIYMYPSLAGQNSHMTKVSYSDPLYVVNYKNLEYRITGNNNVTNMKSAYSNIQNTINFSMIFEENSDADINEHIEARIDKLDTNGEWITVFAKNNNGVWSDTIPNYKSHFLNVLENYKKISNINIDDNLSTVSVSTEAGVEEGTYRLSLRYNDGVVQSEEYYQEFNVSGKYYDIQIEDSDDFSFNHNISKWKYTYLDGVNIEGINSNLELLNDENANLVYVGKDSSEVPKENKLVFSFGSINDNIANYSYYVGDYDVVDGEIIYNVYNSDNQKEFMFKLLNVEEQQTVISKDAEGNEVIEEKTVNKTRFVLQHVANVPAEGDYSIKVQYYYNNNDKDIISEDTTRFTIKENVYDVEILKEYNNQPVKPVATFDEETNDRLLIFYVKYSYIPSFDKAGYSMVYKKSGKYYEATNTLTFGGDIFNSSEEMVYQDDDIYIKKITFKINEDTLVDKKIYNFDFRAYYDAYLDADGNIVDGMTRAYDTYHISGINNYFDWKVLDVSSVGTTNDNETITEELTDDTVSNINSSSLYDEEIIAYNNLKDTSININIDTPYLNAIDVDITSLNESISYKNYFDIDNNTDSSETNKKVILNYSNTNKLDEGHYKIKLSYGTNNIKEILFRVIDNYVGVKVISSSVRDMFLNTNGVIDIQLKLTGIQYNNSNLHVSIIDPNERIIDSNTLYSEFKNIYVNDDNKVVITKAANNNSTLTTGHYRVKISYEVLIEGVPFEKTEYVDFDLGQVYFDFTVDEKVSTPVRLVRTANGTINYRVHTSNINNLYATTNGAMKKIINNTKIFRLKDDSRIDYTDYFRINGINVDNNTFDISITYSPSSLLPSGVYEMETSYKLYDSTITYSTNDHDNNFIVNSFSKEFDVTNKDIFNLPIDGLLHNNLSWDIKYTYTTNDVLFDACLSIKIYDENGIEVPSNKYNYYVDNLENVFYISYNGDTKLNPGKYTIRLIYDEDSSVEPFIYEDVIDLKGNYKKIVIDKVSQSNTPLISDIENQSYKIHVNTDYLSTSDYDKLKVRVTDQEGFVLYTDRTNKQVLDSLTVNNTVSTNGNITITFNANKFRVGTYNLTVELPDEVYTNEYNSSNVLTFTMESTLYNVTLNDTSYIESKVNYDNNGGIYDDGGANIHYEFETDYISLDASIVSIQTYRGLEKLDTYEISNFTENNGIYSLDASIDELKPGEIDFAICINGLPYNWITKTVLEKVVTKNIGIKINGISYGNNSIINISKGSNYPITIVTSPASASDRNFVVTGSDNSVAYYNNGNIYAVSDGSITITISNSDKSSTFTINVASNLLSDVYTIDNDNKIIYISNEMSNGRLSVPISEFVTNFNNLDTNYNYNKNDNNKTDNVATGDVLVSSGVEYKIIFKSECNGDGKVTAGDYVIIKNHIMGKTIVTNSDYLNAMDVNGTAGITAGDYVIIKNIIMKGAV